MDSASLDKLFAVLRAADARNAVAVSVVHERVEVTTFASAAPEYLPTGRMRITIGFDVADADLYEPIPEQEPVVFRAIKFAGRAYNSPDGSDG